MDTTEQRNPVEVLAEEFIERQRRGEHPTVAEYADTNPALADEIRQLFPTILAMERVKRGSLSSSDHPVELPVDPLGQLGDYRIVREIGRGGMGIVYEAEQQSLGRRVAVKVLPGRALGDSKHLRRFRREARTAALLHHTNIVQVFGVGEQDGLAYYVMQLIQGIGLDKVIDQLKAPSSDSRVLIPARTQAAVSNSSAAGQDFTASKAARALLDGAFVAADAAGGNALRSNEIDGGETLVPSTALTQGVDGKGATVGEDSRVETFRADDSPVQPPCPDRNYWRSVVRIGAQIAEALGYAHAQGTFHRDIKPANLLLDAQGTVWVTDFGLAKAVTQEELSQSGDVVGTLRYMAPEQLAGLYDARSDIYSLGLTLYELVTLQPAYADADQNRLIRRVSEAELTPPRKLRPAIPRDLETVVLKAIAREPQHRYQTAGDLADDLRYFLDDRPIKARRVGPFERLWRWSRRNPAIASLSAVLLIVVLGSFAAISWKWREAESEKRRTQGENRRAEANLSLALDSMDQFLDRFASTWMAHPTEPQNEEGEQQDIGVRMVVSQDTAMILQDALKFYDQFAEQNASSPRLQRETARAHRRVGDIHDRLGQYERAESAYRQAATIFEEQLRQLPDDQDLAAETAATLNQLGFVLHLIGRHDDARKQIDRARQIFSDALEGSPLSPRSRYELARTHSNLGIVLWRLREPRQAAHNHRRAIDLLEQLVEEHPRNGDYRLALARAYRSFYPLVAFGPRQTDTAKFRADAISILEQLVEDFPDVPDYQCELSETLAMIGNRSPDAEYVGEREAQLRRAVDFAKRLTGEFPTIPRYRAALARGLQELGSLLRRKTRAEEADPLHGEAVTLYRSLAAEFPSIEAYQFFLSGALHSYGDTLRDLDRLPESRKMLEMAILELQSYLESRLETHFGKSILAWQNESLARTFRQMGEDQLAEQAAQEAGKIRADLEEKRKSWWRREGQGGRSEDREE